MARVRIRIRIAAIPARRPVAGGRSDAAETRRGRPVAVPVEVLEEGGAGYAGALSGRRARLAIDLQALTVRALGARVARCGLPLALIAAHFPALLTATSLFGLALSRALPFVASKRTGLFRLPRAVLTARGRTPPGAAPFTGAASAIAGPADAEEVANLRHFERAVDALDTHQSVRCTSGAALDAALGALSLETHGSFVVAGRFRAGAVAGATVVDAVRGTVTSRSSPVSPVSPVSTFSTHFPGSVAELPFRPLASRETPTR